MSKRFSRSLWVSMMSLLPLTQGLAVTKEAHAFEHPPQLGSTSVRDMVIRGNMLNQNTLQINAADIPTAGQANQARVISLTDHHGVKQRFMLLPPDRTYWVRELQKYNGSIKEFNFYSIVDEQGNKTDLLASKRIVTAPANQLTVVFPSAQDAQLFFTEERQTSLVQEGFVSPNLQAEMNHADSEVQISVQDKSKASGTELITGFPRLSMLYLSVQLLPPGQVAKVLVPVRKIKAPLISPEPH